MDFREFSQEISKVRHIPIRSEKEDLIIGLMVLSVGVLVIWFRNLAPYGIDSLRIERLTGLPRITAEAVVWVSGGASILFGIVQLIAYFFGIPF
jgi:hypothetical protein